LASAGVELRELDDDLRAADESYERVTKTGGDARANGATIFESHPKQCVR
jgi:hypothetical protein